ncbi:Biotin-protein ligase [Chlamydiales bacterium STE3]|nr:Biotin-protein ligase [Chlamydiales bacterium STE3]
MKKKILIYSGPGALKEGIEHLLFTLRATLKETFPIQLIGCKELLENQWELDAALFILPGGADIPYVRRLKGKGNSKIRSFVENGGSFLGICAGSYYAGNYVEFAIGSSMEVQGDRELSFFPGTVRGPLMKEYSYRSQAGSMATPLFWSQNLPFEKNSCFTVFYSGGGYFVNADKTANTDVLAYYGKQNEYPALIECKVGKGTALLSGAHFEYDHSLLNPNDIYLKEIIPHLEKNQENRLKLATHIFQRLIKI